MNVTAVIPVWNEAGAIGGTVRRLPRASVQHVIVVDGGSSDGTQAEAVAAGAEVLTQKTRGYGAACAEGRRWRPSVAPISCCFWMATGRMRRNWRSGSSGRCGTAQLIS